MCALSLDFLRAGPPPPKVVLLPDALFFTRVIPIVGGATSSNVAAQSELALEGLSPFPVTQLYHGFFWSPGMTEALIFASYRRRFPTEQTAQWSGAALVIPNFAATLGARAEPATTYILRNLEGITAVHWGAGGLPARVAYIPVPPDATDETRARLEAGLLDSLGGSRKVIEITTPPVAEATGSDRLFRFRSGDFVSEMSREAASSLDVRDKEDLAELRRAESRDLWLWRILLGGVAALGLLALGELSILAGQNFWQKGRAQKVTAQRPVVEKIMSEQEVANRIDELATKRLLPMEMITTIVGEKGELKPDSIIFNRTTTIGLDTLVVDAQISTTRVGELDIYQTALEKLPAVAKVEVSSPTTRGDLTTFRLTVVFKPIGLKPSPAA